MATGTAHQGTTLQAEEVNVAKLFASDQQFLIPLWQRRYSWNRADWDELWRDIERVRLGDATNHFIGSVVLHARPWSGRPSEAKRFWVVDGQQRLTTLTILVCAIRDRLAGLAADEEAQRDSIRVTTSQLLVNSNLTQDHTQRLVLQELDAVHLEPIVLAEDQPGDVDSAVVQAYRHFSSLAGLLDEAQTEDLLVTVLSKLNAVWVTLEGHDNAHRVFQTLNAGGKPLKQADLVRNYFFLLLGDGGDSFYAEHWKELETDLAAKSLEEYFVAWSISQGHNGARESLFRYFQRDLSASEDAVDEVRQYGRVLVETARLFRWIRNPELSNYSVAKQVLGDLKNWGTVPAEGLILHLQRAHATRLLSEHQLATSLEIVLSFLARRMLAGFEPQLHKSIFVAAARRLRARRDLHGEALVQELHFLLSQGDEVRTWPGDELITERVISNALYSSTRASWVFVILERVNRSFWDFAQHAPRALSREDYTIEHVMPQTLSPAWESDLESWGVASPHKLHASRVHALGNLTLSPINSHLSNRPFDDKRRMLADDWLRINQDIVDAATWSESRIDERSRSLARKAVEVFIAPMDADAVEIHREAQNTVEDEVADALGDEDAE